MSEESTGRALRRELLLSPVERRAHKLLRRHLTAEQRADWNANAAFNVRGSEGNLYRLYLRHPGHNNIVASHGRSAWGAWPHPPWDAFVGSGSFPLLDVLLGQKITLEGDENYILERACRASTPWAIPPTDYEGAI